ncbi:MAG: ABC transporter permease [Chlamydiae bacterium]|nr:ABC transporter permease [Chlamydiota bacterium]MBI3276672.1 ABC transporter permease [Chlamydiota bacterium]
MALPLKYSIRNLWVRKTTTTMTIVGMGLTVGIFICLMAFTEGIRSAVISTGSVDNIILMRDGSVATEFSVLDREILTQLKAIPEAKTTSKGEPLVSPEYHIGIPIPVKNGRGQRKPTRFRGVLPIAFKVYENVRVSEGHSNLAGSGMVMGRAVAERLGGYRVGDHLRFSRGEWTVVGILDGNGTSYDSEIWVDLNDLLSDQRKDQISCVTIKLKSIKEEKELNQRLTDDPRLHVKAMGEIEYYEEQSEALSQIHVLGNIVALLMAIAAIFGGMNTMYAAVAGRIQEIATLRFMGFKNRNILLAILIESWLIALGGVLVGSLMGLVVNGISLTTLSPMFSEITFQFRVTLGILSEAFLFALVMGLLGGILPARSACKVKMATALREE